MRRSHVNEEPTLREDRQAQAGRGTTHQPRGGSRVAKKRVVLRRCFLVLGGLAAAWGCVTEPGLPWGRLSAQVALRFAPPPSRLTASGAFKTANDDRLQNLEIHASVAEVVVRTAPEGTDTGDFDPANPPEGYSLCHNGHCHAADGSLPTYEEIAAKLGTAQSTGPTVRWLPLKEAAPVRASATGADLPLAPCGAQCDVGLGQATLLEVHLTDVRIKGDASGLNGSIGALDVTMPGKLIITKVIEVPFDRAHAPIATLDVDVQLPATLLDDVPLSDHISEGAVQLPNAMTEAVLSRLREDADLSVKTTRSWP